MSVLSQYAAKVREILKAAQEKKPAVPKDPGDPDELQPDYRVGDASPTEKDAEEAKEDGGEDAEGKDSEEETEDGGPEGEEPVNEEGDEGEEDGPAPGEDQGEDEEDEEPRREIGKSFDEFGNCDLSDAEVRDILKAHTNAPFYGPETNPIPEESLLTGGDDLKEVLDDVMALIVHQQEKLENFSSVMDDLRAELARVKKGMKEHDRSITKALETLGDPKKAPAAAPRAFNKALTAPAAPESSSVTGSALANQIFADLKAGKITQDAAMAMCRSARS